MKALSPSCRAAQSSRAGGRPLREGSAMSGCVSTRSGHHTETLGSSLQDHFLIPSTQSCPSFPAFASLVFRPQAPRCRPAPQPNPAEMLWRLLPGPALSQQLSDTHQHAWAADACSIMFLQLCPNPCYGKRSPLPPGACAPAPRSAQRLLPHTRVGPTSLRKQNLALLPQG